MRTNHLFPLGQELQDFLKLQTPAHLDDLLSQSLLEPVRNLLERPGKGLRSQMVQLGFELTCRKLQLPMNFELKKLLQDVCEILEILHAGSLIIDDIEDGTLSRRGEKTLHLQVGLPVALNAGNWLYFLPFERIEQLRVSQAGKARIRLDCQRTLLRAHYGQALDVGVSIEQIPKSRIYEVSLATMELKSGVLAGFALKLGALAAAFTVSESSCLSETWFEDLESWGRELGLVLQMFDDIGNLTSKINPEKQAEDLRLRRPSFVLAVASQVLDCESYQEILQMLSPPQKIEAVLQLLNEHKVAEKARQLALEKWDQVYHSFQPRLNFVAADEEFLQMIKHKLVTSYE